MPLYQYQCVKCYKEWEAWHSVDERMNEFCCGNVANLLLSLGTIRPNGVTKEQPKIPKHEPYRTQIIKDGKKTVDQSIPNSIISETNAVIDKLNAKQGYQVND